MGQDKEEGTFKRIITGLKAVDRDEKILAALEQEYNHISVAFCQLPSRSKSGHPLGIVEYSGG